MHMYYSKLYKLSDSSKTEKAHQPLLHENRWSIGLKGIVEILMVALLDNTLYYTVILFFLLSNTCWLTKVYWAFY